MSYTLKFFFVCSIYVCSCSTPSFSSPANLAIHTSPVLTATGFVNEKGQFDKFRRPTESIPPTDHPKICHRWLRWRPLRLCQIRCISVHGGLLGIWVKYNRNYYFIYALFGNSPTSQTRWWIFTHDGSNDADSRTNVPFWDFFLHCYPFMWLKTPQKQFWGVNRRFQAKLAKSNNVHIIHTTASISTKYCTVIKTTKCPSWVVFTHVS